MAAMGTVTKRARVLRDIGGEGSPCGVVVDDWRLQDPQVEVLCHLREVCGKPCTVLYNEFYRQISQMGPIGQSMKHKKHGKS